MVFLNVYNLWYAGMLSFFFAQPLPSFYLSIQTIRAVQPDVVVVELCQYRVSMLKMDENTLLKEAKDINMEKVRQAIKQVWLFWLNMRREINLVLLYSLQV